MFKLLVKLLRYNNNKYSDVWGSDMLDSTKYPVNFCLIQESSSLGKLNILIDGILFTSNWRIINNRDIERNGSNESF